MRYNRITFRHTWDHTEFCVDPKDLEGVAGGTCGQEGDFLEESGTTGRETASNAL
jgi:hypothetical protein